MRSGAALSPTPRGFCYALRCSMFRNSLRGMFLTRRDRVGPARYARLGSGFLTFGLGAASLALLAVLGLVRRSPLCARVARPPRRVETDSVSCSASSDPRLARSFLAAQFARSAEPDPGCPGVACFRLVRCGLVRAAGRDVTRFRMVKIRKRQATTDKAVAVLQKADVPVDVVLSEINIPGSMNGFGFAQCRLGQYAH
jgi:hypothetical protein